MYAWNGDVKGSKKMVEKIINVGHRTGIGTKGVLKNDVEFDRISYYFQKGIVPPCNRNSYGIMFTSIF